MLLIISWLSLQHTIYLDTAFETEIRGPEIHSEMKIDGRMQYLIGKVRTEGSSLEYYLWKKKGI